MPPCSENACRQRHPPPQISRHKFSKPKQNDSRMQTEPGNRLAFRASRCADHLNLSKGWVQLYIRTRSINLQEQQVILNLLSGCRAFRLTCGRCSPQQPASVHRFWFHQYWLLGLLSGDAKPANYAAKCIMRRSLAVPSHDLLS